MAFLFCQWEDRVTAARLITDSGYYGIVEPGDLVGLELYALEDLDHELLACIAVIRAGVQAYVDYLVVRPDRRGQGGASYLMRQVAVTLQEQKVRIVHLCVSGENGASAKMLMRFGAKIGWPYINAVVRLEDDNG